MKKKIIVVVVLLLLVITGCSKIKEKAKDVKDKVEQKINMSLLEFDTYKDIVLDKITSIDYARFTVAGREDKTITDKEEIREIYNNLKNLKIVQETTMACEDNTKLYTFNLNDGKKIKVELECNWLVHGNKRYEVK